MDCVCSTHAEFDLLITNTIFQQWDQLKTTWMHPRSRHWHFLDYVLVRQTDRKDVLLTKGMRGAECWTDHKDWFIRLSACKIRGS